MAYAKHQRLCIELKLCVQCGERSVRRYRRCAECRRQMSQDPAVTNRKPRKLKPLDSLHPEQRRRRRQDVDHKARRGYWPEVHGEV